MLLSRARTEPGCYGGHVADRCFWPVPLTAPGCKAAEHGCMSQLALGGHLRPEAELRESQETTHGLHAALHADPDSSQHTALGTWQMLHRVSGRCEPCSHSNHLHCWQELQANYPNPCRKQPLLRKIQEDLGMLEHLPPSVRYRASVHLLFPFDSNTDFTTTQQGFAARGVQPCLIPRAFSKTVSNFRVTLQSYGLTTHTSAALGAACCLSHPNTNEYQM